MNIDLSKLVPELRTLAERHQRVCIAADVDMRFLSGFRSSADQWVIFGNGREQVAGKWKVTDKRLVRTWAMPDQSPHCRGAAYDFCCYVNGQPSWDREDLFRLAGALGKALGLVWGGDWAGLRDLGHCELSNWKELPWNTGSESTGVS